MEHKLIAPQILSGISFVNVKPIFSNDYKFLFLISKFKINIFNINTGKCVGCLFHDDMVNLNSNYFIGAEIYVKYKLQLITLTSTGLFALWNYTNGRLVKTCDTKISNIKYFTHTANYFYLIIPDNNDSTKYDIAYIKHPIFSDPLDTTIKHGCHFNIYRVVFDVIPQLSKISFHPLNYFVSCVVDNQLKIMKLDNYKEAKRQNYLCHMIGSQRFFTCVNCHPKLDIVATGDNTGRILLWNDILSKHPIKTVYHWHFFPLHSLAFSSEGSYLFSGGKECVCIRWNLRQYGDRIYLPRFDSEIINISVSHSNDFIAVALKNNSVKLTGFQLDTSKYINVSGLLTEEDNDSSSLIDHLPRFKSNLNNFQEIYHKIMRERIEFTRTRKIGLIWDTRYDRNHFIGHSCCLVTNGPTGYVQGFDPIQDEVIYKLDICHQNAYTGTRYEIPNNTQVIRASFLTCPNPANCLVVEEDLTIINSAVKFSEQPSRQIMPDPGINYMVTYQLRKAKLPNNFRLSPDETDIVVAPSSLNTKIVDQLNYSSDESYLKFWEFNDQTNSYALNTSIMNPHGFYSIDIMEFLNSSVTDKTAGATIPTLITLSSGEGTFRLWSPVYEKIPGNNRYTYQWSCKFSSSYGGLGYTPICMSYDTTSRLLAIAWCSTENAKSHFYSQIENTDLMKKYCDLDEESVILENSSFSEPNLVAVYGINFGDGDENICDYRTPFTANQFNSAGTRQGTVLEDSLILLDDSISIPPVYLDENIKYIKIFETKSPIDNLQYLMLIVITSQRMSVWTTTSTTVSNITDFNDGTTNVVTPDEIWKILWQTDFSCCEGDICIDTNPSVELITRPSPLSEKPFPKAFVTSFDVDPGTRHASIFLHHINLGTLSILFDDLFYPDLRETINLTNCQSSLMVPVQSKTQTDISKKIDTYVEQIFKIPIVYACIYGSSLAIASPPQSLPIIYYIDTEQHLYTFKTIVQTPETHENPHKQQIYESSMILPPEKYDLLQFDLRPYGDLSSIKSTPFGELMIRDKASRRRKSNSGGSGDPENEDDVDNNHTNYADENDLEMMAPPVKNASNPLRQQQLTNSNIFPGNNTTKDFSSGRHYLDYKRNIQSLNQILFTCNAHTFPDLNEFGKDYMEAHLIPITDTFVEQTSLNTRLSKSTHLSNDDLIDGAAKRNSNENITAFPRCGNSDSKTMFDSIESTLAKRLETLCQARHQTHDTIDTGQQNLSIVVPSTTLKSRKKKLKKGGLLSDPQENSQNLTSLIVSSDDNIRNLLNKIF